MYQHLQDNFLNFKKTHQITVRTTHFKEADSQPEMVFSQEFSFHISIASDMQMTSLTPVAESEEEQKNLLMKVKEESRKAGLKLIIQ